MKFLIITGSSRGIGSSIAKKWCEQNQENMYFGISQYNDIDVSDYEKLEEYFTLIDDSFKDTIALINNAGIIRMGSILEISDYEWNRQFDVNVNGTFYASKLYVKHCIKNKVPGKIINIASTAGLGPRPGRSAYSATKAAMINFSLSIAQELDEYNIKVYCVCPSAVNTEMRKYINPDDNFNDMLQRDEVANFVISLINDGKYLDNQILKITK